VPGRLVATILTAAAIAALPATADAATLSLQGDVLVYRGDGAEGNSPSMQLEPTGELRIEDPSADAVAPGPCTTGVFDYLVICDVPAGGVRFELGAGGDNLTVADDLGAFPIAVSLGDGLDTYAGPSSGTTTPASVDGGAGDDTLTGGAQADVLRGGPGRDTVNGKGGADRLYGDDGDDDLKGDGGDAPGADLVDGGGGIDTINGEWEGSAPIDVSLDGLANDGRSGEGDNITNVEKIWTTARGKVAGSAGNDDIYLFPAASGSTILGLGGDDVVKGGDGDETIDGGAGADSVIGGRGNDTLTGGAGPDRIFGDNDAGGCGPIICSIQSGSDTIEARDGERDVIDCGVGNDTARVDAADVVSNCETVETGGSPPGGGSGGGGSTGGQAVALRLPSRLSLRTLAAGSVRIGVACRATCVVSGRLVAPRSLKRRLRLDRRRIVAAATARRTAAGNATLRLRAQRRSRARVKQLRRATLTLVVTVTEGNAKRTTTRALKFRR